MSSGSLESIEHELNRLTSRQKVEVIELLARSLREAPALISVEQRRMALNQLRKDLAVLPVHNPSDGWSAREHDRLLYGESH